MLEQFCKTPIVQFACEKLGIARATYYRWRQEDALFAKAADDSLHQGILLMNDMAESQLLSLVRDGELPAVIFWLRSRHPAYGNKVEVKTTIERKMVLTDEQKLLIKHALELTSLSGKSIPSPAHAKKT